MSILSQDVLSNFCQEARGLPTSAHMAVIRTWTNGWATSQRFHESRKLKCIFGCDEGDCLNHYLQCDILWPLLLSVRRAHTPALNSNPAERAAICNISRWSICNLWVAFQAYHSLKIGRRDLVDSALTPGDYSSTGDALLDLLSVIASEIPGG